jgi:hypothetical protein
MATDDRNNFAIVAPTRIRKIRPVQSMHEGRRCKSYAVMLTVLREPLPKRISPLWWKEFSDGLLCEARVLPRPGRTD